MVLAAIDENLLSPLFSLRVQKSVLIPPFLLHLLVLLLTFKPQVSGAGCISQFTHTSPRLGLWLNFWHSCNLASLILTPLWEIAWYQNFRGRFLPSLAVNFRGHDNYKQCQLYALAWFWCLCGMIWEELKGRPDENIFLFSSYSVWHPQ